MQSRMLLQCLAVVVYCLLTSARPYYVCNADTDYECECSQCWDTVAAMESLDWITVSLMECPLKFNDTTIRKRIASWINEECGASINCGLRTQLDANQIVIGHFECETERNELRLVALLNRTNGLNQGNVLPAHLLGLVLQSREHLLSFLLHSEILSATVHRRLKGTRLTEFNGRTAFVVVVAVAVFVFFILLLIYFSQIYVNWSRIVKGEWSHKDYRKVPHAQITTTNVNTSDHESGGNVSASGLLLGSSTRDMGGPSRTAQDISVTSRISLPPLVSDPSLVQESDSAGAHSSQGSIPTLYIVGAAIFGVVIIIVICVIIAALIISKKKKKEREKRLAAALDEEERKRKERAIQKTKSREKEKEEEEEAEQQKKKKKKKKNKKSKEKSEEENKDASVDQLMWALQNDKMEEVMRDPSVDANPKDVNKMVKELQEKRMAKMMNKEH